MKNLRIAVVCLCISLLTVPASAQNDAPVSIADYNKPKLFNNLPEKIPFSVAEVDMMLVKQTGQIADLNFSENHSTKFEGTLISVASKYNNAIQTIVLKSSNFNGAVLNLSKTTLEDGSIIYNGRILSFQHGDSYILENRDGIYYWQKKGFYELINN